MEKEKVFSPLPKREVFFDKFIPEKKRTRAGDRHRQLTFFDMLKKEPKQTTRRD